MTNQMQKLREKASSLSIDEPSQDPASRVHQIRVVTAAYKSLTNSEPALPPTNSPLPALLALRSTHGLIIETKALLLSTREKIKETHSHIQRENQDLLDSQLLSSALEQRIQKLQSEFDSNKQLSPDELANKIIFDQQQKKRRYAKELRNLMRAFNKFVDKHLAAMLAVEELGGPVVGDMLDIDEEILKAGFTKQGNAKKPRVENSTSDAKRKTRIDEIWGPPSEEHEVEKGQRTEKEAAGGAFRNLSEDLLNAAAGDNSPDPYISIPRETAAVRFLIRAHVAQLHPKDAKKLRLVDFGRELGN